MNYLSSTIQKYILETLFQFIDKNSFEIIIFGSYATGKIHDKSDIDIALKGRLPLDSAAWSKVEEAFRESSLKQKVDIVDYHRVKKDFQKIIDQTGICLR